MEELFDDEFEFELLEELELELLDEFELELLDELELELDELLPATMIEPSLRLVIVDGRSTSGAAAEYSFASTAVLASAAMPATRADLSFQCLVMVVTPFSDGTGGFRSGGVTGEAGVYSVSVRWF